MLTMVAPTADAPRLLVVDDRKENLYAFRQILASDGYQLDLASSAHEAFRLLLKRRYVCVLCDVQMPDMDGYELVSTLRMDSEHAFTPVIFITAHSGGSERVLKAYELGALDFITKPVEPAILRARVSVIVKLQEHQDRVQRQKELFEATMGSLQEGVMVFEADQRASFHNQAMTELWRGPIEAETALQQLLGTPLFHPETKEPLPDEVNPFRFIERHATLLDREVYVLRTGAEAQYWNVSVFPIVGAHSNDETATHHSRQTAVVVRDVTARRHDMLDIQRKNRDLEHFAYAASHDLKAPLRQILSFGAMLEKQLADPVAARETLSYILQASSDMRALVDGLLEVSTIGTPALQYEDINLGELVRDAWRTCHDVLPTGAELVIKGELPVVSVDVRVFRQVILNLIRNSVKFRRNDFPLRVSVGVETLPTLMRIEFEDNGIGIEPRYAEVIFKMFQRLHARSKFGGSGIGLALCKKVMELHGGDIYLRPQTGPGTLMVLELPPFSPGRYPEAVIQT